MKLPALPSAARFGRRFARRQLRLWELDELAEDVELVISELLTNAVRAALSSAGPLSQVLLRLRLTPAGVHVEVSDPDPTPPAPAAPTDLAEAGRGLALVAALSEEWGYERLATGGKTVWARHAPRPTRAERPRHPLS
ncbi:ATP-binding protein [Streptosporangium subroseum]|uniref:ATP-binding protein n=1 Tax=Streptosporangium subroseum TaxID=106412 RepID=UPI00342AA930